MLFLFAHDRVFGDLGAGPMDFPTALAAIAGRLPDRRVASGTKVLDRRSHRGFKQTADGARFKPGGVILADHRLGFDFAATDHLQQFAGAKRPPLVLRTLHEPISHNAHPMCRPSRAECRTSIRSVRRVGFAAAVLCGGCRRPVRRRPRPGRFPPSSARDGSGRCWRSRSCRRRRLAPRVPGCS